jgi:hypothetical protein
MDATPTALHGTRKSKRPKEAFIENLGDELEKWKSKGDLLIIMGNLNTYV